MNTESEISTVLEKIHSVIVQKSTRISNLLPVYIYDDLPGEAKFYTVKINTTLSVYAARSEYLYYALQKAILTMMKGEDIQLSSPALLELVRILSEIAESAK